MKRDQTPNVGKDMRLLRDDEVGVVSGGFIVDGCRTLGGPDTSPLSPARLYEAVIESITR